MTVKPILDDWEIPRISHIETLESRSLIELPIPGKTGSVYQDLNTTPTRIAIAGSLYGEESRSEFVEQIREKYQAGGPVTFVADIVTATQVQYVLIEQLLMRENAQAPDQVDFEMVLSESPPPPPPADPFGGIDTGLLDQAGEFMDSVTGALDAISALGNLPDFGNPTEPLSGTLNDVASSTEGLDSMVTELNDLFGL
jgi:hypothetical protein